MSNHIEEFSEGINLLNDAVQQAVEQVRKDRKVSNAELMCVLSGLLCALAVDCGVDHEDFMDSLSMNFLVTSADFTFDKGRLH